LFIFLQFRWPRRDRTVDEDDSSYRAGAELLNKGGDILRALRPTDQNSVGDVSIRKNVVEILCPLFGSIAQFGLGRVPLRPWVQSDHQSISRKSLQLLFP